MDDEGGSHGCFCVSSARERDLPVPFKASQQLLSKYKSSNLDYLQIRDDEILEVMIRLYVSDDHSRGKVIKLLERCRLNPNYDSHHYRRDLEYFIPQLINYLVFYQKLKDEDLINFIIKASKMDYFLAHLVYFQLKSMSQIVHSNDTKIKLKAVGIFLQEYLDEMAITYQGTLLIATQLLTSHAESISQDIRKSIDFLNLKIQSKHTGKQINNCVLRDYGTSKQHISGVMVNYADIHIADYYSIFNGDRKSLNEQCFESNIQFWEDLVDICDKLSSATDKKAQLFTYLQQINENLPAAVYIPFVQHSLRNYVILNVVYKESRVFSTKMRSPFSICFEIYRPEEEQHYHERNLDQQLSLPLKTNMAKSSLPGQQIQQQQQTSRRSISALTDEYKEQFDNEIMNLKFLSAKAKNNENLINQPINSVGISKFYQANTQEDIPIDQQDCHLSASQTNNIVDDDESKSEMDQSSLNSRVSYLNSDRGYQLSVAELEEIRLSVFGESSEERAIKIKMDSPYKKLHSWRLAYLIVKTGDNLKQEQFALQLVHQFDQIFRSEGLPLKLTHYEVLSIGPNCGIMQMVKNATTIDSLQKNIRTKYKQFQDFSDFFRSYFRDTMDQALNNYLHSLVAYSLVCYFLQVKDRHNGNILLDRDGHMIHIDFGFFLSNAPGKGIHLEKKIPFKLLTEHIKVLGGFKGVLFEENFRKLFFRGFKAAQKHQKEILLLVDMMYTGHGTTLPCFQKGEMAIKDLEARFNPRVASDAELYVFTQELINASLDNWRAKWYDKFQYFVQGVFY